MARMQQVIARFVIKLHCCVGSSAAFAMACCAAGEGGKRQIGIDGQNGKLEQQLELLTAAMVGGKQTEMVTEVVMGVQMWQELVLSAWKMIATLSSRRVGICAPALTALSASIDALFVELEAEPSECIAHSLLYSCVCNCCASHVTAIVC